MFQPAIGQNTVGGFGATDTMQFSAADFGGWSDLLGHASQVGSDTVIALDAKDTITLTNVAMGSLLQPQFSFV